YYLDVHGSKPRVEKHHYLKGEKKGHRYEKGESHGIPYRCLVPRDLANVLVAGRSISCDRQVQGSVRVMPVCLAMGEAAGIAAGLACKAETVDVHQVDTKALRARLLEEGAYIL
ncbi:MAG: FAD-dependent oxidoreductase, partial [Planctomycetes bacterium]|nr:FAD-dependent oxidoreductase [Planctomycetota bacterium]